MENRDQIKQKKYQLRETELMQRKKSIINIFREIDKTTAAMKQEQDTINKEHS